MSLSPHAAPRLVDQSRRLDWVLQFHWVEFAIRHSAMNKIAVHLNISACQELHRAHPRAVQLHRLFGVGLDEHAREKWFARLQNQR